MKELSDFEICERIAEIKKEQILTQEYLKECIYYNQFNGSAVWKRRPLRHFKSERDCKIWNSKNAANMINCLGNNGYIRLSINGNSYSLHRIIFLYMEGRFPEGQVDHINRNKRDNRFENLRDVSPAINSQNQNIRKNNKSGVKGIYWNNLRNKWHARITINKKVIHLGYYANINDAKNARQQAESRHMPSNNRINGANK